MRRGIPRLSAALRPRASLGMARWLRRRARCVLLPAAISGVRLLTWAAAAAFVPALEPEHTLPQRVRRPVLASLSRPLQEQLEVTSGRAATAPLPPPATSLAFLAAAALTPGVLRRVTAATRGAASRLRAGLSQRRAAAPDVERSVATKSEVPVSGEGNAEKSPEGESEVPFFEEVSGEDPLVQELEERLRKMNGNSELTLDMVLNPGTIVNVEREIILLRAELKATPEDKVDRRKEIEDEIEKKQMKVVNEMRQVMNDGLKLEFLLQALLSVPLFGAMVYNVFPLPDLEWLDFTPLFTQLMFNVFGLWGVWLVTIPALRARKPGGPFGMGYEEKRALDVSFLIVPWGNLGAPFFTKDPVVPFWFSLCVLAGCYVWSFNTPLEDTTSTGRRGAAKDLNLPEPLVWALKSLDFGTGSERGARSEDQTWKEQLEKYERAAEELVAANKAEKQKA